MTTKSDPDDLERITIGDVFGARSEGAPWRGYQAQSELGLLAWLAGSPGLDALTMPPPKDAERWAIIEAINAVFRESIKGARFEGVKEAVSVRWPGLSGDSRAFFDLARITLLSVPEGDPILEEDVSHDLTLRLAAKQLAFVVGEVTGHPGAGRARWVWALLHWWARLDLKDPGAQHFEMARALLRGQSLDEEPRRVDELARAFMGGVRRLQVALGLAGRIPPDDSPEGAFLDKAGAFFEGIGGESGRKYGARLAKVEEASPGGRWLQWFGADVLDGWPTTSTVLRVLVRALWADEVGPALDREAAREAAEREAAREAARANRPAVARVFMVGEIFPAMAYGAQHEMRGILPDGRELKDRKGRTVARIEGEIGPVLRGLEKFGAPVGHRLIDSLVRRAWANYEASSQDPGTVEYEGGWSGLARAIGHDPNDTATLRALAEAGQSIRWDGGLAYGGGWWTWAATRGGPGKPGRVRFNLGDPLRPAYITALELADRAHTPSSREKRRAIPILAYEPPVGALNERSHGAAWLMARLFVVALVDGAEQLHLNGGLRLDEKKWATLADGAGLPFALLSKLRDAWLTGDDPSKAPPLIKEVGGGLVTLGDAHELERIFIAERGMRAAEGRAAGKRSAAAKREAAQKKAPRPKKKGAP